MVSWPHGAQDSEITMSAKIVWSCGGSAIEHGVGLGGRADCVDRGTSWQRWISDLETKWSRSDVNSRQPRGIVAVGPAEQQ
jgi:hypothetical protein